MHSGGVQQCAQRSQPAQSDFWGVTGLVVRSPKHSFAAAGAARRRHSRGLRNWAGCLCPPQAGDNSMPVRAGAGLRQPSLYCATKRAH